MSWGWRRKGGNERKGLVEDEKERKGGNKKGFSWRWRKEEIKVKKKGSVENEEGRKERGNKRKKKEIRI